VEDLQIADQWVDTLCFFWLIFFNLGFPFFFTNMWVKKYNSLQNPSPFTLTTKI